MSNITPHSVQNALLSWREESIGDKSYFVVNGVPLVEGVLNGRLVEAKEFGAFVKDWNGVPVVMRHPKSNGGSARVISPDVPVVGRFYNAKLDGTRLVGEFWLDPDMLQEQDGQELISMIKASKPVEISTGYYAESVPTTGQWNGKDYGLVDQNLHPDHIALLPDEIGACSVADGCGLNRNQEDEMKEFVCPYADLLQPQTAKNVQKILGDLANDLDVSIQNVEGLTGAAADMWEEVYKNALEQYEGDKERASKVAWAAIKKKYKKEGDDWVLKNHYGPGPHESGSSQDVHGGEGGKSPRKYNAHEKAVLERATYLGKKAGKAVRSKRRDEYLSYARSLDSLLESVPKDFRNDVRKAYEEKYKSYTNNLKNTESKFDIPQHELEGLASLVAFVAE